MSSIDKVQPGCDGLIFKQKMIHIAILPKPFFKTWKKSEATIKFLKS
jgi:hypothetical protein